MTIKTFKHKGLKQLFEADNPKGLNAEHVRKIRQILALLDAARTLDDLDYATFRLHALKGDLKGYWSMTVRASWRIVFRYDAGRVLDIDLVDYPERRSFMPMKNPPHPGQMIGDSLAELGMSVSAAARGLGVTRQQLHNLIAGRCAVMPEMAFRLEKALGSTADTWLRLQANYDLAQIRARSKAIKVMRLEPIAAQQMIDR